jgi:hypothetical protein
MAPARTEEDCFALAIKQVPVTEERRLFIQKDGDERLTHTGVLREFVAGAFFSRLTASQALLELLQLLQLMLQVELRKEIMHEDIKIKR